LEVALVVCAVWALMALRRTGGQLERRSRVAVVEA
jgi:hypothetical protein